VSGPHPLTVAVLADVVAAAGGRWTGSASALQAPMISAAGPRRRRGVPLTPKTLSAALDTLAATVDPEDEEAPHLPGVYQDKPPGRSAAARSAGGST